MQFIPWQYINDWKCKACGLCCRAYSVVLNFQEWLNIIKNCGAEYTVSGLNKLFLKRKSDGSCAFLFNLPNMRLCGLQHMKPRACKLWPFKILKNARFGHANEAAYYYRGNKLFVYADSTCSGIKYGSPTLEFANQTLREFVEIAIGIRDQQYKSTANLNLFGPMKLL